MSPILLKLKFNNLYEVIFVIILLIKNNCNEQKQPDVD